MSLEYQGVQGHFISTLLGGARFAGALEQEAKKSEGVARVAVVQLSKKLADYKKLSVAARAREGVLQKQAVGPSVEVSTLQEASEAAESRCGIGVRRGSAASEGSSRESRRR